MRNAFHTRPENLLLGEDPDMCKKHVKQLHLDNQEAVYFEYVENVGYIDDEASGDEAGDEEYPQHKSVWPS